jgi:hypothetical protein
MYYIDNKRREKQQRKETFVKQVILTKEAVTRKPPEEIQKGGMIRREVNDSPHIFQKWR